MITVGIYRASAETEVHLERGTSVILDAGTKLQIERPGQGSSMKGPSAKILSGPHKGKNFDLPEGVLSLLAREE